MNSYAVNYRSVPTLVAQTLGLNQWFFVTCSGDEFFDIDLLNEHNIYIYIKKLE